MPYRFRLKLLVAAMGMAAASVASAAIAPAGATTFATGAVAQATALRKGDIMVGPLAQSAMVHVAVALKLRNRDQLHTFIHAAHHSVGVMARKSMSSTQFRANYSPTHTQAQAVVHYLRHAGFTNISVSPDNMLVSADAPASVAAAAFNTSFAHVITADGRNTYANTSPAHIPMALSNTVLSVIGLQDVHRPHTMAHIMQHGAQTASVTGHYPTEFSSIYGGNGQTTGAGVTAGIITEGKLTQTIADLNTFTSNHGLATVTTQTVNTGGTSNDTSGVGEWNLDSQDLVGMAGGQIGKIIFYNMPSMSNTALTANISTVVNANAAKIINVSLGECENYTQQDGSAAAQDQSFQQAVAQGQTFSISTGDSGADECGDGGTTPSWPAASQYVVAVGGTTLNASTTTWNSATVWSDGGGSSSGFESQPSWQNGVAPGNTRGLPDIAYDADPNSGAKVVVNGSLEQIGGTSLSAPLFAGAWARVIAAKGTDVGFAAPLLYQLPASAFHDVTSGNNGGESAGPGYDLATGRGEMIISAAISNIGGGGGGTTNTPPTANFSDTVNGLDVSFTDTSSDSDGSIASHAWTFGDGGTSTAANPSHTYTSAGTYSVTETVTDNDGATDSKTASVTVSGGGGGGGGSTLQNGVAVTGLSGATGGDVTYTVSVPAGATNLVIAESGGSGDADLYVKFGSAPTLSSYDCRPYKYGNNESCPFASPQAGTYYVTLHGYQAFSGVSLSATWDEPSGGGGGGGGGSGDLFSNNTHQAIRDHGHINSYITVSGEAVTSSVAVNVNITHPYRGDIKLTLYAPSGESVVLKNSDGSDSANDVHETYNVTLPTTSGFANGQWQLRVDDVYRGDKGTLTSWSLQF